MPSTLQLSCSPSSPVAWRRRCTAWMPRQQMHDGMSGGEANSQDILKHHSDPVVLWVSRTVPLQQLGGGGSFSTFYARVPDSSALKCFPKIAVLIFPSEKVGCPVPSPLSLYANQSQIICRDAHQQTTFPGDKSVRATSANAHKPPERSA